MNIRFTDMEYNELQITNNLKKYYINLYEHQEALELYKSMLVFFIKERYNIESKGLLKHEYPRYFNINTIENIITISDENTGHRSKIMVQEINKKQETFDNRDLLTDDEINELLHGIDKPKTNKMEIGTDKVTLKDRILDTESKTGISTSECERLYKTFILPYIEHNMVLTKKSMVTMNTYINYPITSSKGSLMSNIDVNDFNDFVAYIGSQLDTEGITVTEDQYVLLFSVNW